MKKNLPKSILYPSALILIILFCLSMHAAADDGGLSQNQSDIANDEDETELNRLLAVIDKHTEIATRSKLNVDYVPGMVTVLEGKDLLSRGVRNVREALRLVPGVDILPGNYGSMSLSVRGLSESFGYASNMFMLNGVPVNSALSGKHDQFWGIPISQVERIEVIRGPGSAVHGGYANTGAINVITRSEGNSVYGEVGQYETYGAGGLVSWSLPHHDFRASLNLAGMDTDGADTRSGPDKIYSIGQGEISNAPGPANEDRFSQSAFMNLDYKDFSFLTQYMKSGHGDYFGVDNALPDDSDGIAFEYEYWNFELHQRVNITPTLWFNAALGYLSFGANTDDRVFLYPPGFTTPAYTYPYGMAMALSYKEARYNGSLNMTWTGLERHRIFTECAVSHTYQGDTWYKVNLDIDTAEPDPANTMLRFDEALIGKDRERRIGSIVVQDEYSASDSVDITAGLRYDQYNDTDDSLSPRLAGAWRLSDTHIFKIQYAKAFMPPSFLQLYQKRVIQSQGNTQLKPQTSENYELGYIFRGKDRVARFTFFHTDLTDLIVLKEGKYSNIGGARLTGVELELEQSLLTVLKLNGNISYVHTEDKDTGEPVPETANLLANIGITCEILRDVLLNAQYRYVGERNREPRDTRGKLDAFHTVDMTGSLFNLFVKGLTLRAGIKNVLNEDVRYAAPMSTYPEDYPTLARRWWAEITYEF